MSQLTPDILSTLAYFDLFDFPLTDQEIYTYLPQTPGYFLFSLALKDMLRDDLICCCEGYYVLRDAAELVQRRRKGEKKAAEMLKTAGRIAGLLSRFPFVRGVAVSGSLSKHFADEQSDIDFFIVTAANRLWIARTLLHLLKKAAILVHRQDYFCMNYFVDETEPEITDKNIYTAIEVATLIPMSGDSAFRGFFQANRWTHRLLPNHKTPATVKKTGSLLQSWMEKTIDFTGGDRLEKHLRETTARRWNRKTAAAKKTAKGHILEMAVSAHCSKPAANGFHDALMNRYRARLTEVIQQNKKLATG